jgi:hypothetical protein
MADPGAPAISGLGMGLPSSEILNVNVSAQAHVVGKIPADAVRIVIGHDLIATPEPVPEASLISMVCCCSSKSLHGLHVEY